METPPITKPLIIDNTGRKSTLIKNNVMPVPSLKTLASLAYINANTTNNKAPHN